MAKQLVKCPQCRASYKIDDTKLGKKGRCSKCGNRFTLALSAPGPAEPLVPEVVEEKPSGDRLSSLAAASAAKNAAVPPRTGGIARRSKMPLPKRLSVGSLAFGLMAVIFPLFGLLVQPLIMAAVTPMTTREGFSTVIKGYKMLCGGGFLFGALAVALGVFFFLKLPAPSDGAPFKRTPAIIGIAVGAVAGLVWLLVLAIGP